MADLPQHIKERLVDARPEDLEPRQPMEPGPETDLTSREEVEDIVVDALGHFMTGFEDRLAIAMRKALDTALHERDARLKAIEEDLARVLRHLGLEE